MQPGSTRNQLQTIVATAAIGCSCALSLHAVVEGDVMATQERLPDDRDREHVEVVKDNPYRYSIAVDSDVDGVMTRDPVGYQAYRQHWRMNRFVRLRNIGTSDVVNPCIIVNEKRRWQTLEDIAREAVGPYTADRDRARAIWEFTRRHRFHATTWDNECNDPVKVFNVYGYTLCGNDAHVIADLWTSAGLETRNGYPVGHSVSEVFYDGAFHLLDGDEHCIYLLRDNETIASEADVVADHDLIKRTHTYGILRPDNPATDQFSASLFGYEGERKGRRGGKGGHTMAFRLRPGEAIEWRWDHIGKEYTAARIAEDGKYHGDGTGSLIAWGDKAYANLRNGVLLYEPNLSQQHALQGIHTAENLIVGSQGNASGLAVMTDRDAGVAVWRHQSPYVMVGGRLTLTGKCAPGTDKTLTLEISSDGKTWDTLASVQASLSWTCEISLDGRLSPRARPQYDWWLKARLPQGFQIGTMRCRTDLQMAHLGLPALESGRNTIRYVDNSPDGRQVEITHAWTERPAWHRPAPPNLRAPENRAIVAGTDVHFSWNAPSHPDKIAIADYHIEVSAFSDMRWPLSPNTEKLLSKTAFAGKSEWRMPGIGLLNPATSYFWRVRARDKRGVWGPWSNPQRFSCKAPGVPLEVLCEPDRQAATLTLKWRPNPQGEPPVKYKVYGSDERGFTASDTTFKKRVGRGFCRTLEEWEARTEVEGTIDEPPNLLFETTQTEAIVAGPGAATPAGPYAFYRVVAIDAQGIESGPSAQGRAPRPFFCTLPETDAAVGKTWSYQPLVTRSIGDLQCKRGYKAAYWNAETLSYTLLQAPAWIQLDPNTGQLSGQPTRPVREQLVLRVENNSGEHAEQTIDLNITTGKP